MIELKRAVTLNRIIAGTCVDCGSHDAKIPFQLPKFQGHIAYFCKKCAKDRGLPNVP